MKYSSFKFKTAGVCFVAGLLGCSSPAAEAIGAPGKPKPALNQEERDRESEPPALSQEIVALVLSHNTAAPSEQIARIGKMDLTPTQKAQALLVVLPTLNKDGQRQIAQAVVKYVDDKNCGLLRRPLLEGKWNRQVLSVFLTDTLKRQNRIKAPLLLALARTDNHPLQIEARELLVAYVGLDHGTNWSSWEQSMTTWLVKNPD